jgi:hypothetical protein
MSLVRFHDADQITQISAYPQGFLPLAITTTLATPHPLD